MKLRDPNIAKLELIAQALGPLREQVVFVGGCAVGLLITDEAAAPVRATMDVDLVAPVTALSAYHSLEKELSKLGFKRDLSTAAPICRWHYRGLEVDVMPADSRILGFANRWYPLAVTSARSLTLPSGTGIRLVDAPVFVATKFEAHADRGVAICSRATTSKISSMSSTVERACSMRLRPVRMSCTSTSRCVAVSCWRRRASLIICPG